MKGRYLEFLRPISLDDPLQKRRFIALRWVIFVNACISLVVAYFYLNLGTTYTEREIAVAILWTLALFCAYLLAHRLESSVRESDTLARLGGEEADLLLKRADSAMYKARKQGGGAYLFYDHPGAMVIERGGGSRWSG
jgi:hypothetical protein